MFAIDNDCNVGVDVKVETTPEAKNVDIVVEVKFLHPTLPDVSSQRVNV